MTDTAQTAASDIPRNGWVDRFLPAAWRPYARLSRLDRPIGTWLLLFPCWWSILLARPALGEAAWLFVLFGLGALVMRGAGCTYNDLVDRDFDAAVARTADRPIPSGQVSVRAAVVWLVAQLVVGLVILLQLNLFSIGLGVLSLLLVFTYPLMKRITWWPQFFLGLAFNWGALMGYAAMAGELSSAAILLYIAGVFWTLGYDTIYAIQDLEDDALAGVKSSARRLGAGAPQAVLAFYAVAAVLPAVAGVQAGLGAGFYVGLSLYAAHLLAWQATRVRTGDPALALKLFKSNVWAGAVLFVAIVAGALPVSG